MRSFLDRVCSFAFMCAFSFVTSDAKCDLLFTSIRYADNASPKEIYRLSELVVHAEKHLAYDDALLHKRQLLRLFEDAGSADQWHVRSLSREIDDLAKVCSLPPSERQRILELVAKPLFFAGRVNLRDSRDTVLTIEVEVLELEKTFGLDSMLMPRYRNILAALHIGFGDYDDARNSSRRAGEVSHAIGGERSPEAIRAKCLEALIYRLQGRNNEFQTAQNEAISAFQGLLYDARRVSGVDVKYIGASVEQAYQVFMARNDFAGAQQAALIHEELTKSAFGDTSREYIEALLGSAMAFNAAEDWKTSLQKSADAFTAAQAVHRRGEHFFPHVLHQTAKMAMRARRIEDAKVILSEAQRIFAEGHYDAEVVDVLINRSIAAEQSGDLDDALKLSDEALARAEKLPTKKELMVQALEHRADLMLLRREPLTALEIMNTAVSLQEVIRSVALVDREEVARLRERRGDVLLQVGRTSDAADDFKIAHGVLKGIRGADYEGCIRIDRKLMRLEPPK